MPWAEAAGIRVLHQVGNRTCEGSLWSPDSRHILEDKTAAYKPCAYTGEAGGQVDIFYFEENVCFGLPLKVTKCPRAAPRTSRGEGFCRDHSRAVVSARFSPFSFSVFSLMARFRHRLGKRSREESGGEGLILESLKQYRTSGPISESAEVPRLAQLVLSGDGRLLGEESGGEEGKRVGEHWPGENESDAESVDSEGEDGLKHAGVYTGEEVIFLLPSMIINL